MRVCGRLLATGSAAVLLACLPQADPPPQPPAPYGAAPYAPAPYGGPPAPYYPPARYAAPQPQPYPVAPYPAQVQPAQMQPRAPQPASASTDSYAGARQRCLEETNAYRARVGAASLAGRADKHACTDTDARGDATSGTVHGGSCKCGFDAQNECPRWDSPAAGMITSCLASMFSEGPGEPYQAHGHYINMTSPEYRGLACGFHETPDGHVWLVQNYFR